MAEGFRALSVEELDRAIDAFEFILRVEREAPDEHLATLAHFWKGRAHRKKGEYETALHEMVAARELAQKNRESAMLTAVIQIHESWVLFQKGLRKEALRLLAHAEATLKNTDHYLALGNIESARGRIVRRSGEYLKALEHFDRAIAIYSSGDPDHRSLARTLVKASSTASALQYCAIDAGCRTVRRASKRARTRIHGLRTRISNSAVKPWAQLRRAENLRPARPFRRPRTVIVNSGLI
jgi:tetratricopeptide (TPR) repeat protein